MRQCMDADNLHRRLKKSIGQVQAIDRYVSVAAFAIGNQFMYDYIDRNPRVHIRRGFYTNDPMNICKNDKYSPLTAACSTT